MTRINLGIPVRNLTDEHLLAEHREIKRIPESYKASIRSGSINRIPNKFCLGKGHVLYFVDKPAYTFRRYLQLYRECLRRGFDVQLYSENWDCYPDEMFYRDIRASSYNRNIIVDRIIERIKSSPKKFFHYCGERITKRKAIKLLRKY